MSDVVQVPQFNRWSGNSQGQTESLKLSQSQSGRGSYNLQLPAHEDNPLSPGYTEPLCVSQLWAGGSCILNHNTAEIKYSHIKL